MDRAHKKTDKRIDALSKKLAKEYKTAEKELKKTVDDYFKKFAEQDASKRALLDAGKISNKEYIQWRQNKMLYGKTLQHKVDAMSDYLANTKAQAANVINGELAGVYAVNYNFSAATISGAVTGGASFVLHDRKTVERLVKKNPRLLPKVNPDKVKGKAWSRRKINNVITQGVLQGQPIPNISKGLERVVGMEWSSAVRNARTAMTGAENAGRMDCYEDAKQMGIQMKKQWVATLDDRTRESHADIDGEVVEVDERFSNGLMYPADPDGDPAEVYNCRCTMIAIVED